MNRKQLLDLLRKQGYTGPSDLSAIKKWLDDTGYDSTFTVHGKSVTVDEAFSKTVKISIDATAGEDVEVTGDTDSDADGGTSEGEGGGDPGDGGGDSQSYDGPVSGKAIEDLRRRNKALEEQLRLNKGSGRLMHGGKGGAGRYESHMARKAYAKRIAAGKAAYDDADLAEAAGAWYRLTVAKSLDYPGKASDRDIVQKAGLESQNTAGGALVPMVFIPAMIDLKEKYGVARQLANFVRMSGPQEMRPRKTGRLTVYLPGEGNNGTESNATYDDVELVAREWAIYCTLSNQLLNDAAINVADDVSRDIAWGFVKKEDDIFFNGDGTSTYFHTTGVRQRLKGLSGTIAYIAGLKVGTGNAYSELVEGDFNDVVGLYPEYDGASQEVWVVHKRFWSKVMLPIANAKGGVSREEFQGRARYEFLGAPVIISQQMPRTEANSQVCALYGDFSLGSMIGEVMGSMAIATSEHVAFQANKLAIRGTTRVAINVHDVGNADSTEANREPGPIVGLITAAS